MLGALNFGLSMGEQHEEPNMVDWDMLSRKRQFLL